MKIAVLGAGAMGSVFGGILSRAGNDVTLVDPWREAVGAINRDGLAIQDKTGNTTVYRVPAVSSAAEIRGPVDLVLVFVKCYHTADAVKGALPLLGPDTLVLSLQNGWGNGPRIASLVGPSKVILGVCYHSATVLGPGRVLHAGSGATFIGPYDGAPASRVDALASALRAAGIPVEANGHVLREIWSKLALNVATLPTSSALRLTADRLLDSAEMQSLMRELLREVEAVAQAQGIEISADERWAAISQLLGRLAPGSKGSMLQDVERQRATEIDVICGAIVDAGRRLGIATPYNHAMLCLVKSLEATFPK